MLIGYARVSTDDQNLNLQLDAMAKAEVPRNCIYEEYISGTKANRPELKACLRALRPGDVLVVWRLDRLGRNLKQLIEIGEEMLSRGIGLRSLSEAIDTTTPGGKLVFHIFGAVAQFERDLISERTKAGLKAAKARGRVGGRKPAVSPAKLQKMRKLLEDPEMSVEEVAQAFGVTRSTFYRAVEREKEQARRRLMEVDHQRP